MAVFEALIAISKNGDTFSEAKELLLTELKPYIRDFKIQELKLSKDELKNTEFDESILLRDFAADLWNNVLLKKINQKPTSYCSNVLEKMLNRMLIQTKETIFLLSNEMGLSAISNARLFMESFAIVKYIIKKGEMEAERFVDYSYYQEALDKKMPLDPKFINKYGENNGKNPFYAIPYGWCSAKKMTGEKLIKKLGIPDLLDYYRLTCNYIHASPYSLIHISKSKDPRFPMPKEFLIKIVNILLYGFIMLLLDYYLNDAEKHPYLGILDMLAPDMFINGEENI